MHLIEFIILNLSYLPTKKYTFRLRKYILFLHSYTCKILCPPPILFSHPPLAGGEQNKVFPVFAFNF